jgi:AbrB family looped-hinge helix DNA binding protein
MRATGIVRRVDDLGRIVIPREIRRTLRIKDGDPLELFVEDDRIIFQKYDVSASSKEVIEKAISFVFDDDEMNFNQRQAAISKLKEALELLKS